MLEFTLVVVLVLVLSLVIAGLVIRKSDSVTAALLGLLPILIMQIGFNVSENASVQRCLESACASAGLPPDCNVGEFGCNEWSGLSRAMVMIAGIAQSIFFFIGYFIILAVRSRRNAAANTPHPPRDD